MKKPQIAILVRRNYWHFPAGPVNGSTHRSVPDIMRAIRRAGGEPVLIYQGDRHSPDQIDGVVLPGGNDLHPQWYGQQAGPAVDLTTVDLEFDRFQLSWAAWALAQQKPLLGICRGMQVLNVAAGGSLHQDVAHHSPAELVNDPARRSQPVHGLKVAEGSRLRAILGDSYLRVNSIHHQAVDRVAEGLVAVAWAPDGVVEAVESRRCPWQRGVQFHPEDMQETACFQQLFQALVDEAGGTVVLSPAV